MKKFLMYGLLLAGMVLTSCQYTELIDPVIPGQPQQGETRLQITVEEESGSMMPSTRATVDPISREIAVGNLHLLFFEYTADGSGTLAADYEVKSPYLAARYVNGEPFDLEIGTGEGVGLSHTERYTVLAYGNIDLTDVAALALTEGTTTENDAREIIYESADGYWNNVTVNAGKSSVPMSGTTTKEPNQELVTLKLTRMVVRFDVQLQVEGYGLERVHVFQMAGKSRIWESLDPDDLGITGQTYNYASTSYKLATGSGVLTGGYAFENFVGDPIADRNKLTTLVLQLRNEGNSSVRFYRVDLHPEGEGQSLKRNHVYQVTVKGIVSEGAANELSAFQSEDQMLDYPINNWGFDEEALILNDGTNLLVAPSRVIRFGPEEESREYIIYTSGTGTLDITKRNLPDGFTATLSGNTLTVTAEELPAEYTQFMEDRTGDIELGFAGLRGTLQIIQTPRDDNYLNLDKKSLTEDDQVWPAGGADVTVTNRNEITVSSSGPWTAKIYNTSEVDPGFSFLDGMFETSGVDGGKIKVTPTGPNPSNSVRQGFILVTLDADKKYRQVLVMLQDAQGTIEISPSYDPVKGLPFDAGGFAKLVDNGSTQTFYRINVRPGQDRNNNLNAWDAELSGTHEDFFNLTKVDDPIAPYVIVSAKGDNNPDNPGFNFGGPKEAILTITLPSGNVGDGSAIVLPVTQEPLVFDFTRIGSASMVPVTGSMIRTKVWTGSPGRDNSPEAIDRRRDNYEIREDGYRDFVEYRINLPASLQWTAEIVGQSLPATAPQEYKRHEGYMIDSDGNKVAGTTMTGRTPENTLRVGFDMIYYPLIQNIDDDATINRPEVTIRVSVVGVPSIDPVTIITRQEPLTPKSLEIIVGSTSTTNYGGYGSFSATGDTYATNFRETLMNSGNSYSTTNFGPGSNYSVRTRTLPANSLTFSDVDSWPDTGTTFRTTRNLIVASAHNSSGWKPSAFKALEDWRRDPETQGMIYFTGLDECYNGYATVLARVRGENSTFNKLGWIFEDDPTTNSAVTKFYPGHFDRRVMKYILTGPFGTVPQNPTSFSLTVDTYHSAIRRSSLGPNAVVIMTDQGTDAEVLLGFDPVARVAFLGESQMFDDTCSDNDNEERFLANFQALLVNAAQYGDHFLELLKDDCPMPLYLPTGTLVAE